jgi:hypothetical protein
MLLWTEAFWISKYWLRSLTLRSTYVCTYACGSRRQVSDFSLHFPFSILLLRNNPSLKQNLLCQSYYSHFLQFIFMPCSHYGLRSYSQAYSKSSWGINLLLILAVAKLNVAQSNIEEPTRWNNNLLIYKISSTCFGQSFAHLQERKTEIFTAYGILLLW